MIATFEINQNKQWIAFPIYNSLNFDERLDEQLDTGNVQIITNTEDAFEDFIPVRVSISDGETVSFYYYYGFDAVEKRGKDYFIHSVELVEPTRLLMGIPIDGRKVSQPIDSAKKTLNTVVRKLLNTFELKSTETPLKFLYQDQEELNVISPEFHWEAGTLLWECLLDIANVVNCMPRLIMTEGYDGSVLLSIVFDAINEVTAIYSLDSEEEKEEDKEDEEEGENGESGEISKEFAGVLDYYYFKRDDNSIPQSEEAYNEEVVYFYIKNNTTTISPLFNDNTIIANPIDTNMFATAKNSTFYGWYYWIKQICDESGVEEYYLDKDNGRWYAFGVLGESSSAYAYIYYNADIDMFYIDVVGIGTQETIASYLIEAGANYEIGYYAYKLHLLN